MIINALRGFCMALADSVPGVSGGTIAFLLGFYDSFLKMHMQISKWEVIRFHRSLTCWQKKATFPKR